ncbi:MAG: type II toxin-antitoxin system HicA family toxin [Roseomonas sp.]|nr:type II toxin-antitoxin system HicA family toxin [Roseomonas sp.]
MTRRDKLVARLRGRPKDFTWDELLKLLEGLGYAEAVRGKTGGSRRPFVHATAPTIALHKPHPGNIVKIYVIDDVLRVLTEGGLIWARCWNTKAISDRSNTAMRMRCCTVALNSSVIW